MQPHVTRLTADGPTFEFRPVSRDDLELVWEWWAAPHVQGKWQVDWRLDPFKGERESYELDDLWQYWNTGDALGTDAFVIVSVDDILTAYLEFYRVGGSPLSDHPKLEPSDRGCHGMIGREEAVGSGLMLQIAAVLAPWQFDLHPEANRIVAEPNVINERAARALLAFPGVSSLGEIDLPGKKAQLLVLERSVFESQKGV